MNTTVTTGTKKIYKKISIDLQEQKNEPGKTLIQRLKHYIDKENLSENRFKWVGISMIVQSVIIMPLAALTIMLTGNHSIFWFFCTAGMYLTFIPSLAGLSVKAVLSTFIMATLVNIITIFSAIGLYIIL